MKPGNSMRLTPRGRRGGIEEKGECLWASSVGFLVKGRFEEDSVARLQRDYSGNLELHSVAQ